MTQPNMYERDLGKQPANFSALTPLRFLTWSSDVYPERMAVVHGRRRYTWSQTRKRAERLAAGLAALGVGRGDTVSVMLANTPELYEAHFGVPMSGAVLNALNTRLDADAIAFMLGHAETKVLITDREFSPTITAALERTRAKPIVVDVLDSEYSGPGEPLGELDYEALLAKGERGFKVVWPNDEWDAIALNYTSGTTGDPKGVVYHHRGAHLNALGNLVQCDMPRHSVFLWTLPMFHCNGWCFPWTMAANAGVNVCLRKVEAAAVFQAIREHKVTHYCGAPIVHTTLINAPEELRQGIDHPVRAFVGGAAPPAAMLEGMSRMRFELTHVYGLTEVYGPSAICAQHEDWSALDIAGLAEKNGRQGVRSLLQDEMTVVDPRTLQPVAADGQSLGEIVFRGNLTMKGYLKNPKATAEAFAGGYFHSGDLAVMQPDGYAKIKDRAKDVIISGGENISSLEVEDALCRHPAVLLAAVVAQPDPKWGETPCAFVELKPGAGPSEAELIEHCRKHIAHFKAPKRVVFGVLPKTSTGKIQKFMLREQARSASAIE
ncbi:MAG TPA: acyl-CoA synthetase [Polyangiales bacterium]|nr:acyl-CoA synthetase [Polyangiales bacterium]